MNISQFSKAHGVSTDTVRYYEKQGILSAPPRQDNGYRRYTPDHAAVLRFVRSAQALGFSLVEIRGILPQLAEGTFRRSDIEHVLHHKMAQIDVHIRQLQTLKKELKATFESLQCPSDTTVSTVDSTARDTGSGAGAVLVQRIASKPKSIRKTMKLAD